MSLSVAQAQEPVHWNWNAEQTSDKEYEVKFILEFKDKIKDNGKLERYKDESLDVEAWQYSGEVEFVQRIKMMAKVKTSISGTLEFHVCTEEKCLPPKKVIFLVLIS